MPVRRLGHALCLASLLWSCAYPATSVEFVIGSDAPPARAARVDVRVFRAERPPPATATAFSREGLSLEGERLFTVVPNGEPRSQRVEVRLQATLAATALEPTQVIRRTVRFSFVPQTRLVQRVFFSMACLNPSTDCRPGAASCTVQDACEERGQTCGDNGECVAVESMPQPLSDASVSAFDVAARRDASAQTDSAHADTFEASIIDATTDVTRDSGIDSGIDTGVDTGIDSHVDTGADSRVDGSDGAVDARMDSSVDARADTGADSGSTLGALTLFSAGAGGHACATAASSELAFCWGTGAQGRTALGGVSTVTQPTRTVIAERIEALSAGRFHTCFVTKLLSPMSGGDVVCYGASTQGQCGIVAASVLSGNTITGPGWRLVATGLEFTCFAAGRGVRCMGAGASGQLGNGTTPMMSATPVTVNAAWPLPDAIRQIDADFSAACVVTTADTVYCWGEGYGATPVQQSLTNVRSIGVGRAHVCAVNNSNQLYCWGNNAYGQLGDGTTMNRTSPTLINVGGMAIQSVDAGADTTCAVTVSGAVYCWGSSTSGNLGNGMMVTNVLTPTRISTTGVARAVSVGFGLTCAATTRNGLDCWGANNTGGVGIGTTTPFELTPQHVLGTP